MSVLKLHVFVLAENRLFREALSRILNKPSDILVTGSASFSPAFLGALVETKPNILLSDAGILQRSESALLSQARKLLPELKIIMIGMNDDPEVFLQAVRHGSVGYILKDASASEVTAAVRAVVQNEAYCPQSLLSTLFGAVSNPRPENSLALVKRQLGLSRREQQLTSMIGDGLTNKEIASQLNLSEQTVKNHVHRMLRKVGARDRLMIVERCREVRAAEYKNSVSL
jgi:DNA-binding NarL/FixJ family response regulator